MYVLLDWLASGWRFWIALWKPVSQQSTEFKVNNICKKKKSHLLIFWNLMTKLSVIVMFISMSGGDGNFLGYLNLKHWSLHNFNLNTVTSWNSISCVKKWSIIIYIFINEIIIFHNCRSINLKYFCFLMLKCFEIKELVLKLPNHSIIRTHILEFFVWSLKKPLFNYKKRHI